MDKVTKIGERIKELREISGTTQQTLADALHVKRETINMWENGGRDLKTGYICDIADYFNISADYLLGRAECKTLDRDIQNACEVTGLSEEAIKVLNEYTLRNSGDIKLPIISLADSLQKLGFRRRKCDIQISDSISVLLFVDFFIRHSYSIDFCFNFLKLILSLVDNGETFDLLFEKYQGVIDGDDLATFKSGTASWCDMIDYKLNKLFEIIKYDLLTVLSEKKFYVDLESAKERLRGETSGKT